jgi:hypothetical protein
MGGHPFELAYHVELKRVLSRRPPKLPGGHEGWTLFELVHAAGRARHDGPAALCSVRRNPKETRPTEGHAEDGLLDPQCRASRVTRPKLEACDVLLAQTCVLHPIPGRGMPYGQVTLLMDEP